MYIDKMIEYLVLSEILNSLDDTDQMHAFNREYVMSKIIDRTEELEREFIESYALNKKSSD